jgi:hypothetical protein
MKKKHQYVTLGFTIGVRTLARLWCWRCKLFILSAQEIVSLGRTGFSSKIMGWMVECAALMFCSCLAIEGAR